jgi:two-component system, cell cycle sensor histidine kinase and response regulator CckA
METTVKPSVQHKGCVLIVDDEEEVRGLLEDMLAMAGVKTLSAADGESALEIFPERRGEIDLVILDMVMPGIGGGETFRRLRAIDPQARVLLTSGYGQIDEMTGVTDLGPTGFLQKPFHLADVRALVTRMLGGS